MKSRYILLVGTIAILFTTSCEESLNNPSSEEIAAQIEGNWSVDESSSIFKSALQGYTAYIEQDASDPTLISIEGFYGLGNNVFAIARITGYNVRLTSNQTLPNGYTIINGTGELSKNLKEITWNYIIDDGSGEEDQVQATYTFLY